ncbi:MAG: FliI/YscN family ATPase [Planctomycetes bacterium]|nr:FliI/YscN family ATPase [Planctomycetota bacterium]
MSRSDPRPPRPPNAPRPLPAATPGTGSWPVVGGGTASASSGAGGVPHVGPGRVPHAAPDTGRRRAAGRPAGFFAPELALLDSVRPVRPLGRIHRVSDLVLEAAGLAVPLGSLCEIYPGGGKEPTIEAEVVGFQEHTALLLPLGEIHGVRPFDQVAVIAEAQTVRVGAELLGRILDGRGRPIDGRGPLGCATLRSLFATPPNPLSRPRIEKTLATGVRALDGLLTCGKGQRIGLFAGSGVGKSMLLGMIARNTAAEVNVISLVGERGREVLEFIQKNLGPEGLARSVVVVATSEQPALLRVKAPFVAATIAEYFRDAGRDVLLLMDSVTRLAAARSEVGLAVGEMPVAKGYSLSAFKLLPKLLERAGRGERGSITALYTVLVGADDAMDPVGDHVRGILDGHIWLSRKLAEQGHYPPIDVLASVSRCMVDIVPAEQFRDAVELRSLVATYRGSEDILALDAYVHGTRPALDRALGLWDRILGFLKQHHTERSEFGATQAALAELAHAAPPPPAETERHAPTHATARPTAHSPAHAGAHPTAHPGAHATAHPTAQGPAHSGAHAALAPPPERNSGHP